MDAEEMISSYIMIRDYVRDERAKFEERMKGCEDKMEALEKGIALFASQNNLASVKTNAGTAFPVQKTRVSCEDRDAFLDFVLANDARQFLTTHVNKDAVKEYMEQHEGQLPPGVNVERFQEWQVRKS